MSAPRLARLAIAVALLAGASGALGAEPGGASDPAARFRGAPTYDFGVTNVKWEAGTPEYSYVTFDLSWSFSWRAKWVEPAATSATGKDLEIENWDAAYVFVKFLPEKDSKRSIERNHWQHASLTVDPAQNVMPAGATHTVHLVDGRGIGVFIYRDAIGHGRNDWKGIKLRWQHPPTPEQARAAFDPAKAAIKVHPIAMVYVPEGPFKVGQAVESGLSHFADGPDIPIVRYDGEQAFHEIPEGLRRVIESTTSKDGGPYLQWAAITPRTMSRPTDGGWRGGLTIPFLVDAEWNGPVAEGTRARRMGPVAGHLWSTHTFSERGGGGGWFGSHIGGIEPLNDDYPTGHDAFYCMKYALTQGQYVDFLNSLPPDVAAGRAFVTGEISTTAGGMHVYEFTVDRGPGFQPYIIREVGGCTITSSTDTPEKIPTAGGSEGRVGTKKEEDLLAQDPDADKLSALILESVADRKTEQVAPPVYAARCPFRRCLGVDGADTRAYAVWAGLRPMSELERTKAAVGARDPSAPDDTAATRPNLDGDPVLLDFGLPTERYAKGNSHYGADLATRVGCRAAPTSDRGAALATYWGISELDGASVPLENRTFRGTHGDGAMPAGTPGASFKRGFVEFKKIPADWPIWSHYAGNRHVSLTCRLVVSADTRLRSETTPREDRIRKPVQTPAGPAVAKSVAPPANPTPRTDTPKVTNVKWEAGTKDYSTVSFGLAWDNSWRAKWEESAEKNVTGKPLTIESWDAAWVFVKFRPAGAKDELHGTLSANAADHSVPAGAALEVGLDDDGSKGIGVFIYRNVVGAGPNDFEKIKLRWAHGETVDPGKAEVEVHAIAMVYIPEGPFASRSPWGHPLTVITTPNATQPGGHLESGTNTVPLHDEWPNGYPAFYCMKDSITQGQYVELLNSVPSLNYSAGRYGALGNGNFHRFSAALYGFNGHTITTNAAGTYVADVPDRMCKFLSLPDILSFTAWAGLRPPTNLEYEKACRGPRAVARAGDAWAPATCAPFDSAQGGPAASAGASYWGIRELSLSGCVQEWPAAVIQNEPVNNKEDSKGCGVPVRGLHGNGSPEVLKEWPWTFFGEWYYGGIWRLWAYGTVGHWFDTAEVSRIPWNLIDGCRTGRYGARAVRTAPVRDDPDALLQINEPPTLAEADVGIFYLTGTFRNDGANPLNVELTSTLPAACFPDGPASCTFTAAPSGTTPFKILTAVTRETAAGAVRRGELLPVRLQVAGGPVLGECQVRLRMRSPAGAKQPVISSLEGGAVTLRLTNATERPCTVAIALDPLPVVRLSKTEWSGVLAAGGEGWASFPVPPQVFGAEGLCRLPCRVTVADSVQQMTETSVNLRTQSRWWISRRTKAVPKVETGDTLVAFGNDDTEKMMAGLNLDGIISDSDDVFATVKMPAGWEEGVFGAGVEFDRLGPLPSVDSMALAATRFFSPGDRQVLVIVRHELKAMGMDKPTPRFVVRIRLNDRLVYEKQSGGSGMSSEKEAGKPVRILKGINTMVVECQSKEGVPANPGSVAVQFLDAKDGKPVEGLMFDVEKSPAVR